ncbi:MAG TPA: hypothetical protein PLZ12_09660 [Saprospiraceae bacterium]|nr:hypothetical protein [Saprospiraceae bacterium]
MKNKILITKTNFKPISFKYFTECWEYIQAKRFKDAKGISTTLLNEYKKILKENTWAEDDDKSLILVLAIGFKAIDDFIEIGEITTPEKWFEKNDLIEKLWIKLWDCKERVDYVIDNFQGDLFVIVSKKLEELHKDFLEVYGNGIYASPEFLIKKETCSICDLDVRACLHISGHVYSGAICKYVVKDFEMRSISLVTVPKDPRCRAWAWNMEGRTIKGMAFFFNSGVDSFLNEDK